MSISRRKRLEYRLLRWQARFESAAFDRGAPWVIAIGMWILLLLLALARSRELSQETSLASGMQTAWLIAEGFRPEASLLGHNYLFEQAGFLIYPVGLLTGIFPTAITLLVIQSAALGLGVVPLWRLARRVAYLRVGSTMAIITAYGAYSAVHTLNVAGFRLEVIALPVLIAAVYSGLREKWIGYWLLIGIALAARADIGLAIAGLGALWWVEGRRRFGYATFAVGFGWAALAILIIQPLYAGGDFPHVEAFASYGTDNPFSVLAGIVSSPAQFAQDLFSEANFRTVVSLLAPVLFLPVVAPRYLLPAVPLYSLYLVADVPEGVLEEAGQAVPIAAFVFVALIFGLAKTGRVVVQKVNVDRRVISALMLTAAVFFARDAATSPYQEPWAWGRQDGVDEARLAVVDIIPDDGVVRAAPKLLPLLTERTGLFALDLPNDQNADAPGLADAATPGVDWIVFDEAEVSEWDSSDVQRFCSELGLKGWVPVARTSGIFVFTFAEEAQRLGLEIAFAEASETRQCIRRPSE